MPDYTCVRMVISRWDWGQWSSGVPEASMRTDRTAQTADELGVEKSIVGKRQKKTGRREE